MAEPSNSITNTTIPTNFDVETLAASTNRQ
jgi:hypothetical protein